MTRTCNTYAVIVGNLGMVHRGQNFKDALAVYATYVKLSKSDHGRPSHEPVTLMKNDDIIREHYSTVTTTLEDMINE